MTVSHPIGWSTVARLVDRLVDDIRRQTMEHGLKVEGIVGIARGGLIPAVMLSHRLGVRSLQVVSANQYDDATRQQGNMVVSLAPSLMENPSGHYLIVDDIVDSGKTVEFFRGLLPNSTVAALVVNSDPIKRNLVDFIAMPNPENLWIEFPWEA